MRSVVLLFLVTVFGGCGFEPSNQLTDRNAPTAAAEKLIDAFYSFDPARLRTAMSHAPASAPQLLYYQGWAKGGNYIVLTRKPCRLERADEVSCAITVRDDLITALGTVYDVTDTFHLSFRGGRIVKVQTSSNDPPEFELALDKLRRERPQVFTGPCREFFAGGPTPQDCVRAVVQGFEDFGMRAHR
jgi:hypothetical protein